jgi:hypothetical protein
VLLRSDGDFEPRRAVDDPAGLHEHRRSSRVWHVGTGGLACPSCDAPVILAMRRVSVREAMLCPFCDHTGVVRDFLSLAQPPRAPRVNVLIRPAA